MGRGVNSCVYKVMLCRGVDCFVVFFGVFLLMWQQVSRDLQQVKAWLTQAPTFFSVITVLPGCFQLCSSQELADICVPEAYFLRKRRSFCAGHFIVNRSFPALCEQESDDSIGGFILFFFPQTFIMTDLTDHSLSEEAVVLHHQLIGLIFHPLVTTSCCHSRSNYPGDSVAIVMICYISCRAALQWLFYFFAISKLETKKCSEEISCKPKLRLC